jgi:hypothetical protein
MSGYLLSSSGRCYKGVTKVSQAAVTEIASPSRVGGTCTVPPDTLPQIAPTGGTVPLTFARYRDRFQHIRSLSMVSARLVPLLRLDETGRRYLAPAP